LLPEPGEPTLDYRGHFAIASYAEEGSRAESAEPQSTYHGIQVSCCGYPSTYILPLRLPGHPASVLIEHGVCAAVQRAGRMVM
jgi:hypothetical protein